MPPTIQNGPNDRDKRPPREGERRSDLVCRVKYCNTLPDIPFDLKFITYPFESTRFIQYNPTSLERNYKYEVLTEHDLGVHIDLINRDIYQSDGYSHLDPADEKLLEEDVHTPQDSKRSKHHAKSVSWLRRSEYISTEQTRFQPQTMEKVEAKVGYNVKKSLGEETLYMDRDSQMKAIEKTFEDSKITIDKHYSKPGVVPVEIMSVFPDFDTWKYPCAQVIFDSDPAPQDKGIAAQIEQMSQAMIRGVMDESGEQFVAYFLPTEETLVQRKKDVQEGVSYTDDQQYEYKMAREYNWNVKSKASKGYEENYFLVVRNGAAYYNELETRVRLSKRRQRAGGAGAGGPGGTRLVVRHRPLALHEHRMQRLRDKQLEPPQEDDEDEMEQEEDEPMDTNEDQEQRNSRSRSRSPAGSKEGSPRKSPPGSRAASEEGSKRGSEAGSRRSSRSKSRSKSRSRSGSRSRSRSKSGSRASRSRSGSRRSSVASREGSGSRRSSRAGSAASQRSRSGSRASSRSRSASKSPSRSRSRSGSRSASGSRAASEARSNVSSRKTRSCSRSKSASKSRSGSEKSRSRSRSRSASGSRQGSGGSRSSSASSRSSARSGEESE